ncbi:MAG: glycosyltransferase family 4 protein, partial [Stellaceae bacterium]
RRLYELMELAYNLAEFPRLWRAYRRERPAALYERYNLFLVAGACLRRLTGIPLLLEVNAPLVEERSRFGGLANRRLAAWVERATWRSADQVLPVTEVLAGHVRAAGIDPRRITVLQNGVGPEFLGGNPDPERIRARYRLEGKTVLGFTGFVREWHGLDRVIDLIADSDPSLRLHLLIVGEGPARRSLEARAAELGISERVTMAGVVPREEVPEYVTAYDIALQPHVVPYASPLKLFEYMALSRAIVAPASPNIREVLVHEETALLFDVADQAAFTAAIRRLVYNPALRQRLGRSARAAIDAQGLTWQRNAERIIALIGALARAPHQGDRTTTQADQISAL